MKQGLNLRRCGMKSQPIHPDFERILLSEKEIEDICEDLGAKLNKDYAGKVPTTLSNRSIQTI
jgi:hypothetical protein